MLFASRFASLAVPAFLLSACVSVPEFHSDPVLPADVALSLKCELQRAIWTDADSHAWLRDWNAVATLNLRILERSDGSGELGLVVPLSPGLSSPLLGFGASIDATRTAQFQFSESIAELAVFSKCHASKDAGHNDGLLLRGNLGIKDWLDRIRMAADLASLDTDQIDYTLDFFIKKTLAPSVRFSLIPAGSNIFGASAKLDLQKHLTHNLKLVLQPKKRKPKPLEVIIVEDQSAITKDLAALRKELADLKKPPPRTPSPSDGPTILRGTPGAVTDDETRARERSLQERIRQLEIRQRRSAGTSGVSTGRGVSDSDKRSLNEGLSRSISTEIRDQLRSRGITD